MAQLKKNVVLLSMPAPLFVAEIVSPGGESSMNYRRDYEWKRQQYEWWQIPEYWIIDGHREQVVVFSLQNNTYQEHQYRDNSIVKSLLFPTLQLTANQLLSGNII